MGVKNDAVRKWMVNTDRLLQMHGCAVRKWVVTADR